MRKHCDACGGAGVVEALGSWGEDGPRTVEVCLRCRGTGYPPRFEWWTQARGRLRDWWWQVSGRIADALRHPGGADKGV